MRLCILTLSLCLAACGGTTAYRSDAPKNLTVRSELHGAKGALHIHRVLPDCRTEYLGSVPLDQASLEVALPVDRPSYLVVSFDTSSFLAGSRSTSSGTLLAARPAVRYEIGAKYRDSIYSVALYEVDRRGGKQELARRDLGSCRSPKTLSS